MRNRPTSKAIADRYTAAGVVFGLCFPITATMLETVRLGRTMGIRSASGVIIDTPLLWIIATAPLFLGLAARLAGRRAEELETVVARQHDVIGAQTADLRLSVAEAEAADAAKSRFLANMSHEIRTPMNGVIGMADVLLGTKLDDQQSDYVRTLRQSGESLMILLNDILDFSKIEAGQFDLEDEPFDLSECLVSGLELLAPQAAEKQIELVYEAPADLSRMLRGDITRVRQILMNLASNAIKFTAEGEVSVRVGIEPAEADDRVDVTVKVTDTGIGLAPEAMNRLFLSFSQIDASTARRFGGTGLGLAISRSLSEMMGGGISADSAGPGKGSTFTFWFPAELTDRRTSSGEVPDGGDLAGRRLLVVDDNETNRKVLDAMACQWGMDVTSFPDAAAAMNAIRNAHRCDPGRGAFDIAVFDYHMPGMDGADLAREVQRVFDAGGLVPFPLVLLSSGLLMRSDLQDLFASTLMKPIRDWRLRATLTSLIAPEPAGVSLATEQRHEAGASIGPAELSMRILIAEDNAVNQQVAMALLGRLGYDATIVGDGQAAVDAVVDADRSGDPIDLVLMDMEMPELDGPEATAQIRGHRLSRQPRITALTANALDADEQLCRDSGMDDFIAKPLRLDVLEGGLARAEQQREARTSH